MERLRESNTHDSKYSVLLRRCSDVGQSKVRQCQTNEGGDRRRLYINWSGSLIWWDAE